MKTFLLFLFLYFNFDLIAQQVQAPGYHLLIGTYSSEGNPNGIHVYQFDVQSGEFKLKQPVTELRNASYLAVSRDRKNVYSVSDGYINAFTFNSSTGALTFLNNVPAQGSSYVAIDINKKVVFSGNYGGGNTQAVLLNGDGSFLKESVQIIQHTGSSVNKERQEKPHPHSSVLSIDDRFLLVPDLGNDRVYQYRVDASKQKPLQPVDVSYLTVPAGSGPRHITFHPNGKYVYLVLELTGSVMSLDFHDGVLKEKQLLSMTEPEFKGRVSGADIHVSPDGKFLYASNRGDVNEIAIFSIDKKGNIILIDRQSVLGKTPRNFVIDPTGNFLLVANQNSNEIIIFKRDKKTGLLVATGKKIAVNKPVCLQFAAIDE